MTKLPSNLLRDYAHGFYGYGTWRSKVWFVGMEEGGGSSVEEVRTRLVAWNARRRRELEDLPEFHPTCGINCWHGETARTQTTWKQLIRILLLMQGESDSDVAILDYQRRLFGKSDGPICSTELFPLPSPNSAVWNYAGWTDLPWLQKREAYQKYMLLERATTLQQRVERHHPPIVIFYGSSWHRYWGLIARGGWGQAIEGKLMGFEREGTAFYVTRHPAIETDEYFRQIGLFFHRKHKAISDSCRNTRRD